MEPITYAMYGAGLLLALIALRLLIVPFGHARPLAYRLGLGASLLWLTHQVATPFTAVTVSINPVTATVSGLLGIPGVLLLFILERLAGQA